MTPSGAALALDIGGTKLAAGVGTADGELTRRVDEPTLASEGATTVLARAIALARQCLDEELGAGGRIDGFGVSTMGLTRRTHVELAPNVPGWEQLRLPEAFTTAFPQLSVVVGNDVKAAAQAEIAWGSLRDVSDGIYLSLGTGVAAGIVSEGRLVAGAHGAAGEVGYTLFRGRLEARMAADGGVPFEEWYGGAGVARRLAGTGLPPSVADLAARRGGDPAAQAFLDELWNGIAVLAANLCVAFDPAVLSLGGGYLREDSGLLERVREFVGDAVPYPPAVVRARFGADASLRGAVALALGAVGGAS